MLDVGSGPASYAIAFAQCYPHLKIQCLERDDQALKIAEQEITRLGLYDRIFLKKGDFFADDMGSGYDLILLSSIICLFAKKENILLLRRAKQALKKGGQVIIWDCLLDESKTKPSSHAIFAVNMIVNMSIGQIHSLSEVKDLLAHSGFKDIFRIPIDSSQVIIGRT
jgi:precorrin-6B methylase 2